MMWLKPHPVYFTQLDSLIMMMTVLPSLPLGPPTAS